MTDLPAFVSSLKLPARPEPPPVELILSASGPAFMALFHGARDAATLRDAITGAELLLTSAAVIGRQLSEAVEVEPNEGIGRQLNAFVEAWPNASRSDLAGYGAQLALDVVERRPCRYALGSALRQLRQTSRFLPSIAEVLAALDDAQGRIRNTAWHLAKLPAELDRARADLETARAREARTSPGTHVH